MLVKSSLSLRSIHNEIQNFCQMTHCRLMLTLLAPGGGGGEGVNVPQGYIFVENS